MCGVFGNSSHGADGPLKREREREGPILQPFSGWLPSSYRIVSHPSSTTTTALLYSSEHDRRTRLISARIRLCP